MAKSKQKTRNLMALAAWNMTGAGKHKDKKKEKNKKACRKKASCSE